MKFLLIAGYPDSLLNFRGALISALQRKGLEVHVAAPDLPNDSELRLRMESLGIVVHTIPLQRAGVDPYADFKALLCLWQLVRRVRPDAVLCYTIKPVIYGLIASWLGKVPRRFALITGLGYAFLDEGRRGALRSLVQKLYGFALRHAHKVFFQNLDDEALFRSEGLLPSEVPSVVLNGSGVDIAEYKPSPIPKTTRFLLIARLLGDKGVREYVEAARSLSAEYPDVTFSLVGWIDENPDAVRLEELEHWINEGAIEFLGRLSDVRPAIANSSVYVLPSYREGTPRTVLEAMAMGRPIITTDAPGCRETVVDGDNGFLVPVKSVEGLIVAMKRFIDDPSLALSMGQRSCHIAREKYDVTQVNCRMLFEMDI
ncbi:MAG: glycosyltransferase family 4 protein [Azonexus sp.]